MSASATKGGATRRGGDGTWLRWAASAVLVAAVHASLLIVLRRAAPPAPGEAPAPVLLDLAPAATPIPALPQPVPVAPAPPPPTMATTPLTTTPPAAPPPDAATPAEPQTLEPAPADPLAVTQTEPPAPPDAATLPEIAQALAPLPAPAPPPLRRPPAERLLPHASAVKPPAQTARMARPPTPAAEPSAPSAPAAQATPGPAAAPPPGEAAADWQSRLAAHLARFKRFPVEAQRRGEQGVVMMRFSMDRGGHVLSAALMKGSGYADLDAEAEAWIRRADPMPPPPAEMSQGQMALVVPLRFNLR